jgi:hypothetical protein
VVWCLLWGRSEAAISNTWGENPSTETELLQTAIRPMREPKLTLAVNTSTTMMASRMRPKGLEVFSDGDWLALRLLLELGGELASETTTKHIHGTNDRYPRFDVSFQV